MREAFIEALRQAARQDPRIVVLTGDLGFSVFEPFRDEFPDRFINAGVAEQNMMGLAAGLAVSGKVPVVYSIANFPTLRCYEQIRNDVVYHEANVKVVSVGGGFAYGSLGMTHYGTEDIGAMLALPLVRVLVPSDPVQVRWVTRLMVETSGPFYLRLGRTSTTELYQPEQRFILGRAQVLRKGTDAVVLAVGSVVADVLRSADQMESAGISVGVLDMISLRPFDEDAVVEAARSCRLLVTVEEHNELVGLGSMVATVLARRGLMPPRGLLSVGTGGIWPSTIGSPAYMRDRVGLTSEGLAQRITQRLGPTREDASFKPTV